MRCTISVRDDNGQAAFVLQHTPRHRLEKAFMLLGLHVVKEHDVYHLRLTQSDAPAFIEAGAGRNSAMRSASALE